MLTQPYICLFLPSACVGLTWFVLHESVDHAADEHGGSMDRIHAGSLAFMSKPVAHSIGRTNSATMLQTLLFWGSYWGQNWEVGNDQAPFGQTALDYAPLFRQLRGNILRATAVVIVPLLPQAFCGNRAIGL